MAKLNNDEPAYERLTGPVIGGTAGYVSIVFSATLKKMVISRKLKDKE